MSATGEELRTQLENLDTVERAELALFLIRSLDSGADEDSEEIWNIELAQRAEQIKDGNAVGEPAEKVFSELRAKYS